MNTQSHHRGNKWNELHANFLATCKLPSQMWTFSLRGYPACGPDWLFFSLLCIAYYRTKPVVFNLFCTVTITATHSSPTTPIENSNKANVIQLRTQYVLMTPPKISFDRFPGKEHKSDFQTTKEFYFASISQIDFRLAAKSCVRNLKMVCSILSEVWLS